MPVSLGLAIREGNRLWEEDQFRRYQRQRTIRENEQADEDRQITRAQRLFNLNRQRINAERADRQYNREQRFQERIDQNLNTIASYEGEIRRGNTQAFVDALNAVDDTGSQYVLDQSDRDGFANGLKLIRINADGSRDEYTERTIDAPSAVAALSSFVQTPAQNIAQARGLVDATTKARRDAAAATAKLRGDLQKIAFERQLNDTELLRAANAEAAANISGVFVDENGNLVGEGGAALTPELQNEALNARNRFITEYNNSLARGEDPRGAYTRATSQERAAQQRQETAAGLDTTVRAFEQPEPAAEQREGLAVGPRQSETIGSEAFGITSRPPVLATTAEFTSGPVEDGPIDTPVSTTRPFSRRELQAIPQSTWRDVSRQVYGEIVNLGNPDNLTAEQFNRQFFAATPERRVQAINEAGLDPSQLRNTQPTVGVRQDAGVLAEGPSLGLQ